MARRPVPSVEIILARGGSGGGTGDVTGAGTGVAGRQAVWTSASAIGIGGVRSAHGTIAGNYTLTVNDFIRSFDATAATRTATLPSAVGIAGQVFIVRKEDASANAVVVSTTNEGDILLWTRFSSVTVSSNGATWDVLSLDRRAIILTPAETLTASVIGTTETAFAATVVLPANLLAAGRSVEFSYEFYMLASAAPPTTQLRWRVSTPTNLFAMSAGVTAPASSNRGTGHLYSLTGTAALGAAAPVEVGFISQFNSSLSLTNSVVQPVALATNAAMTLQLTLQYSANTAGNSMTLRRIRVRQAA